MTAESGLGYRYHVHQASRRPCVPLVTIIDVYSRKILSWQISNTLAAEFGIAALEEAIAMYGVPAIFNTDQGCQFTSEAFISTLDAYGIRISMDGVKWSG